MTEHVGSFEQQLPIEFVTQAGGRASYRSRLVLRWLRIFGYPFVAPWRPTRRGVRFLRALFTAITAAPPVRGTHVDHGTLGDVPVEWLSTERARAHPSDRVIFFIHGGGYVFGSARTHRNLGSRLAHVASTRVASIDYRMPPEASLRASQQDVAAAYAALVDDLGRSDTVLVVADSAGAGHATWLLATLAERREPMPAALVLLSPWTDLELRADSFRANHRYDFLIIHAVLERIARALVPTAELRADWHNSPANAPDDLLAQFPPTLIQLGAREALLDDGLSLATRLRANGVRTAVQVYPGQGHVVPMWRGFPEAREALRQLERWTTATLPSWRLPTLTSAALDEAVASGPRAT